MAYADFDIEMAEAKLGVVVHTADLVPLPRFANRAILVDRAIEAGFDAAVCQRKSEERTRHQPDSPRGAGDE